MNEEQIKKYVEKLGGARCDYPFKDDFVTFIMRHTANKKWFGIYISAPVSSLVRDEEEGKRQAILRFCGRDKHVFVLCLKCAPDLSVILQQNFAGIVPAYHMNKKHWISVILCADVPDGQIEQLITLSYDITAPRIKGGRPAASKK